MEVTVVLQGTLICAVTGAFSTGKPRPLTPDFILRSLRASGGLCFEPCDSDTWSRAPVPSL